MVAKKKECSSKGQLVSKGFFFDIIASTKKPKKFFELSALASKKIKKVKALLYH